jgi:hypothetical protein
MKKEVITLQEYQGFQKAYDFFNRILGLDHGVGHFRLLSITRQRHYGITMSHEGLCQVF